MSYSIGAAASSKEDVTRKIKEQFDTIAASQPSHAADKAAAVAVAGAFVDILADPGEGEEIYVSMYGSLSWTDPDKFTSASITLNASLRKKT